MISKLNVRLIRESGIGLTAALALSMGCAGLQKTGGGGGGGGEDVASDPTSVLSQKSSAPARKITADQRADFEKALATYRKLKNSGPLKGRDCDEAADAFRRAADQNPALMEARHNEAAVYLECGETSKANRIFEELATGQRPYAPAITNLGLAAWQRGDLAGAESLFNRAVQADQKEGSVAARINLAQILRDRARQARSVEEKKQLNDQAIRHLRTVLAVDANSLQAYATLCYIYYDLGLPEAAKLIGGQAIKRGEEIATGKVEDDPSLYTFAADEKGDKGKKGKGKKDEGAEPARRNIALQGTGWTSEMKKHTALVHNTLGLVALDKKSYSDAIASFKRAVDMDPVFYEARLNLAAVSLKFRDYRTAEENFRAVIGAQPKNYEAAIGLGVALRGSRKFDEAEQQYLAAQKLDPQRPESYFNLGLLYQEYKGTDKSVLQNAQSYYREFLGRADGSTSANMKRDAQKRIKDIDELFVALAEAERLQREAEEMQRKAEEQQKQMEERMKKQEEEEKKAGGAQPTATTGGGAAGAIPANAVTPPPAP